MTAEQADKQAANPNWEPKDIEYVTRGGNLRSKPNPKYDRAYHINCQTCAPCYELRLRGFDIVAKPRGSDPLQDHLAKQGHHDAWISPNGSKPTPELYDEWRKQNGYKSMTAGAYMRFFAKNARETGIYIVSIGWQGGGGHATIVQRFGKGKSQVKRIEPQVYNGKTRRKIGELATRGTRDVAGSKRGIFRVDDKLFMPKYLSIFEVK